MPEKLLWNSLHQTAKKPKIGRKSAKKNILEKLNLYRKIQIVSEKFELMPTIFIFSNGQHWVLVKKKVFIDINMVLN